MVHVLVTLTGPVTPAPPNALAVPAVPVTTQPLTTRPDAASVQVKVTSTSLVYQEFAPGVPLVIAHVIVGAILSIRIGPKLVVAKFVAWSVAVAYPNHPVVGLSAVRR